MCLLQSLKEPQTAIKSTLFSQKPTVFTCLHLKASGFRRCHFKAHKSPRSVVFLIQSLSPTAVSFLYSLSRQERCHSLTVFLAKRGVRLDSLPAKRGVRLSFALRSALMVVVYSLRSAPISGSVSCKYSKDTVKHCLWCPSSFCAVSTLKPTKLDNI